jgi:myo-inositol catabolism protein IolC
LHEWCDANRRPRSVIPELKAIAVEGFLAVRERSTAVAAKGAMLLDEQYAGPLIHDLSRRGVIVAAPAERAGAFPLEWEGEPFWTSLTGSMAKVPIRYRPDYAEARVETERRRLRELDAWCRAHDRRWMLEVVVPCAPDEDDGEFARQGRPAAVAQYIEQAYAAGIVPTYWKMEGTTSGEAAAAVDAAIRAQPGVGFLVLGKAAPLATIALWESGRSPA